MQPEVVPRYAVDSQGAYGGAQCSRRPTVVPWCRLGTPHRCRIHEGGASVKRIGNAREGHSTRDCEAARGYGVV